MLSTVQGGAPVLIFPEGDSDGIFSAQAALFALH